MPENIVKLKIADTIIQLQGRFCLKNLSEKKRNPQLSERLDNFLYNGRQKPHILINVKILKKLPQVRNAKHLFASYHFQNRGQNWRLLKKDGTYIYKSSFKNKKQLMMVNKFFDRVTAYLLPRGNDSLAWTVSNIIYDFLQVLLINYFAQRNSGIFIHAVGVKDLDGNGLLFAGKSGSGKTTIAKFWHRYSKAMVLNDDRIIARKNKDKFFIYGSPWHGAFSDYLDSRIESAPLEKFFFICPAASNAVRRISKKRTFNLLYSVLFPTFWDKDCLENIVSFCQDLVKSAPCYSLGFVNNKNIIKFVRKIKCQPKT